MYSAAQLKQISRDTQALFEGYEAWEDVTYFHRQQIAAGGAAAIPAQTQFFNVVKTLGVTNMQKVNEFPEPTIITEVGVQLFLAAPATGHADFATVWWNTEIVIEKDSRQYASTPVSCLPGGGGLSMAIDNAAAGAPLEYATHGVNNTMWSLPAAIAFVPEQTVRVWVVSNGAAVAGGAVRMLIALKGLVARRLV